VKKITSKLTKPSYLILFSILIGITVTSAYALTITLGADKVIVTGDLDLTGTSSVDDDIIGFDALDAEGVGGFTRSLIWDESENRFVFNGEVSVSSLNVVGSADINSILDSTDDIGISGQILSSTGSGTDWIASSGGGTVTSVASGTGLLGGPITSSGALSVNPSVVPFLSNSNTFSGGINTFSGNMQVTGDRLNVDGRVGVLGETAVDDDTLGFDSATEGGYTESLMWDEVPGEFVFSDDLNVSGNIIVGGFLNYGSPIILPLVSDAVTATKSYHTIAAETGTSDTLDTINGGTTGDIIIIKPDTGDTITIDVTGNILLENGSPLVLSFDDFAGFLYDGSTWLEVFRASPAA